MLQMGKYWPKRTELPVEVTATDAASSDESDNGPDSDNDPDTDNDPDNHFDGASSAAARSSPVDFDSNDDENPDAAYARFRAQIAASHHSSFSGWQAELRSWNKSLSPKHTPDMDLCRYWAVCCFLFLYALNYLILVF